MDPAAVIRTLDDLKLEQRIDLFLLEALSQRFAACAEEFFPPQIEAALAAFAELGFSNGHLLRGLVGRLDDVASDASPRRVVRLLRSGAALRLRPDAWLGRLLPQLHRQLPQLHEGLPSLLGSLRALRCADPALPDLLLAQGLLAEEAGALGAASFPRLFERWSRHAPRGAGAGGATGLLTPAAERAEARAAELAAAVAPGLGARELLELLAGLARRGRRAEAAALEGQLEARLRAAPEEALPALAWMRGLALRSPVLLRACGDAAELARGRPAFARRGLPDAVHALAALAAPEPGARAPGEAALAVGLLGAPETLAALPRYSASQALQLLHAACLLHVGREGDGRPAREGPAVPWAPLVGQVARLARKLTLPERRTLSLVMEYLRGAAPDLGAQLAGALEGMPSLPVAALPPLMSGHERDEEDWVFVETGAETLLREAGETSQSKAVKFLGFGDTLTSIDASAEAAGASPACQLMVQALGRKGWQVELRE